MPKSINIHAWNILIRCMQVILLSMVAKDAHMILTEWARNARISGHDRQKKIKIYRYTTTMCSNAWYRVRKLDISVEQMMWYMSAWWLCRNKNNIVTTILNVGRSISCKMCQKILWLGEWREHIISYNEYTPLTNSFTRKCGRGS
jgi:hypothetical protein